MTLSDLKPRGYRLSDTHPDFPGMSMLEWWGKMIASQCDEFLGSPAGKRYGELALKQKWNGRAIVHPKSRDRYGILS
jgi:hypothetical protein